MLSYKNISELDLLEEDFPVFFSSGYLNFAKSEANSESLIITDLDKKILIPLKLTKLRLLRKVDLLFAPLDLAGSRVSETAEREFLETLKVFLKTALNCDVVYPPLHISNFQLPPSRSIYFNLGIIRLDIEDKSEDELLMQMKPNYRNEIRKLLSDTSVQIETGQKEFESFYKLYSEAHKKKGIPFNSKSELRIMLNEFGDNISIYSAYADQECQSSIFLLRDKQMAYYWLAGNTESSSRNGLNKLLIYQASIDLSHAGIRYFILGGFREKLANSDGLYHVQKFKLRFGAEIVKGIQFIMVLRPLKYKIFIRLLNLKGLLLRKNLSMINLSGLDLKRTN